MNKLSGLKSLFEDYVISHKIAEGSFSAVFQGSDKTGTTVIVKVLKHRQVKPLDIVRFAEEYGAIIPAVMGIGGMIKIHDIVSYENRPALVLENFQGMTLRHQLNTSRLSLGQFFNQSVQLAKTLGELHLRKIVHRNIKPNNIFILHDMLKIGDWGVNSIITRKQEDLYNPEVIKETLPYISPEQTGRINRAMDHRSDLYSLGIVLYEMLTGAPPFSSNDPMEIIHAHIARTPAHPRHLNPEVPVILSDIIMKLLEKTADDRYQNGFGLLADLNYCREMANRGRIPDHFNIGANDLSPQFILPRALIGREKERELIISAFKRTVSAGGMETLLINGDAGIGKTALILELQRPAILSSGFFIIGKNDALQRDLPYRSLIQALNSFVNTLLLEQEDRLGEWKKTILDATGKNGRVLTDIVPKIELIIGRQPDLLYLPSEASQKRFNTVLLNFIKAIPAEGRPMTLCIDDLQWADPATINFLRLIIEDETIRNTLIILSYRGREITRSPHVADLINTVTIKSSSMNAITVGPLNKEQTVQYVGGFIRKEIDEARTLGEFIYNKTHGNPFFINQFMKSIHDNRLFVFDEKKGWQWDLAGIKKLPVSDNVVELLIDRINKMDLETRTLLMVCSCFGERFNPEDVVSVAGMEPERIIPRLNMIENEGLVDDVGGIYAFSHDRIIEAAYSLIPDEEKDRLHYQIGSMYLNAFNDRERDENINLIVNQLNAGRKKIESPAEKKILMVLNITAAEKAKKSIAYESSYNFFKTAIELAGDDIWETDYRTAVNLHTSAAEAAFLCADFPNMNRLGDAVIQNGKTLLDKIKIHELKIESLYAQNKLLEGINEGMAIIRKLGYPLPEEPKKRHVIAELLRLKSALRRKKIGSLVDMPDMDNLHILTLIHAMKTIATSAFKTIPLIVPIITFRAIRLSLKYGISPITAYSTAAYGMILCSSLGRIEEGYEVGAIASELNVRPVSEWMRSRTLHLYSCMILHWKSHIRDSIGRIQEAKNLAMDSGDTESATSSIHLSCLYSFLSAKELHIIAKELKENLTIISLLHQETNYNYCAILSQTVLNLLEPGNDPGLFRGHVYDESLMVPVHMRSKDKTALCLLNIYKMMIYYYCGRFDQAVIYAEIAESMLDSLLGTAVLPVYYFFDSLTRLAILSEDVTSKKTRILTRIKKNQKKLGLWARHAPMNYLHKYDLIEAERSRILGDIGKAEQFYLQAIAGANKHHYLQEEALANELAAKFYLLNKHDEKGEAHMRRAFRLFSEWGSAMKTAQMARLYPGLLGISSITADTKRTPGMEDVEIFNRESDGPKSPDYYALIQSLQAISGEIKLKNLISRIMRIIIQNAGAQRGVLMLIRNDKLAVDAEGKAENDVVILYENLYAEDFADIPHPIINYVQRTGETVVLDDAAREGTLADDAYIARFGIRSLLCMPIIRQKKIMGIAYLENALTAKTFNSNKLEILKLLSTQAAISLENALLFEKQQEAENEIKQKYQEIQRQYETMEAMNAQMEEASLELEDANTMLERKTELLEIFKKFAENSGQGLAMTDLSGTITYMNISFCAMLGKAKPDNIYGEKIINYYPEPLRPYITDTIFPRVLLTGQMTEELPIRTESGDTISTIQNVFLIKNNFDAPINFAYVIADITELKMSAEVLRQSEERYRLLVETMKEGLCMVDTSGNCTFVNNSLCDMLGYSKNEMIGRPMSDFLDEPNKKILYDQIEIRKKGVNDAYELEWNTKDKSPVNTVVSPQIVRDAKKNYIGSFSVITDITERRRSEKEKDRMREQLLQSQKMEAIGTLAGGIAHDFNNQLTAIMGYGQLLLTETSAGDSRSLEMHEILKAAERSASLTRQLLAFSRQQLLKPAVMNLNDIVADMGSMLRRVIGEDIELATDLDKDLRLVNVDKSQFEQIIMNLTVNARDAMSQGGKLVIKTANAILDEKKCASLPDSRPGRFVRLTVIDNGVGMTDEIQQYIFEPFYTTKESGKGTGLGLSVVYGIIKQHGGWINVASEPEKGTEFTIYFPAVKSKEKASRREQEPMVEMKGRGELILLVEDQDEVRAFAKTALERSGYRVLQTSNAREAEAVFNSEGGKLDLLFCDVVLPDENGVSLARRLLSKNNAMKVILTSGYTDDKSQWNSINKHGYRFLQKPYTLFNLLATIAEILAAK